MPIAALKGHHKQCHAVRDRYTSMSGRGVIALAAMARGKELPAIPRPWWHFALVAGFLGLAVFTIISLVRRGASGWAWLFWGFVFLSVGYILSRFFSDSDSGSADFGGGSFGGGSSGGGGASGSW
jgi:uncharacterized protein